jgi:uncharacterized protein (DUF362 family)/ferredoxin
MTTPDSEVVVLRDVADSAHAARTIVDRLGGMRQLLAGRRVAVLKPNFVAGRPSRTGATTSFELIAALAEAVHDAGAQPVLAEAPGTEFDREATFTILGVRDFCRQHDIDILDPPYELCEVRPPGARRLKRFHYPRLLNEACLINLPVLKTHVVSGMSLSMKNLMGLLPLDDRRSMHTLGIQQSILDLNLGLRPDLNIVDGAVGQHGEGPLYGEAAHLGLMIGGSGSLAVDVACCRLVGVDPASIEHLRLAIERWGLPPADASQARLAGLQGFRLPRVNPLYRLAFWLMYPLDYPFAKLAGSHLCTALYKTGIVGTRPAISAETCTRCGRCVEVCPLPGTIDLSRLYVNPRTCERCLLCWEACPEGAISVKGASGATDGRPAPELTAAP